MTATMSHTWYIATRHLRALSRQPWSIAFMLMQPAIYLLIFGAAFKRVVDLPGFGAKSYVTYLTPGIVIMSALFSAGWNGIGVIEDIERGVLDRLLASPVRRPSLVIGRITQLAVVTVIQSVIMICLGFIVGARFSGGLSGIATLIASALLLAVPFGALSSAIALVARKQESVIAVVNFLLLPLTLLSSVFMAQGLMPGWMQEVIRFNPVNWAMTAGRAALSPSADWSLIVPHLVYLSLFGLVSAWLATLALQAYQRSA